MIQVDNGEEGVVFSTPGSRSRFLVIWKSRFWGLYVVGSKNVGSVLNRKTGRRKSELLSTDLCCKGFAAKGQQKIVYSHVF